RPLSVLGPELERTGAPRLRAAILNVLDDLPPGAPPQVEDILAPLYWRAPRRSPWQPSNPDSAAADPVRWILAEAANLGLIALGGLTGSRRLVLSQAVATPHDE